MYKQPKILPVGDKAVVVEFGDEISIECNNKVLSLDKNITSKNKPFIVSTIPTYRSLLIKYDPLKITFEELLKEIKEELKHQSQLDINPEVIEIPVKYGGDFGADIDYVAQHNGISVENVIKLHTKPLYRIYMIGFTMGFAYLGGMSKKIETPRLEKPRTKIPAGSVGIAGKQTGIYPVESPGGWRLIGKTPVKLYDPHRENPILIKPGNYIRFVEISEDDFFKIESEIKEGSFKVKKYNYKILKCR